jgi:hypothetical protein
MKKLAKYIILVTVFPFLSSFHYKWETKDIVILLKDKFQKRVNKGFIHVLSNDLIVNDISWYEWSKLEKRGVGRISKDGSFILTKREIERNNKIKMDSIGLVYRCEQGIGFFFKVSLKNDTTIQVIKPCK